MVEQKKNTTYKIAIVVLILIIVGLIAFPSLSMTTGNKAKAEENVKELYRLVMGGTPEIIKTVEQNGLYRISIRFNDPTGKDTIQDILVTNDGSMTVGNLVDLGLQRSLLTNQSAFVQCLVDKKVIVLGISSDAATQAQLQVLGSFAGRIYLDCNQNQVLCQQLGITAIPMIIYDQKLYQGPLNLNWFEDNAGCYMTANGSKV